MIHDINTELDNKDNYVVAIIKFTTEINAQSQDLENYAIQEADILFFHKSEKFGQYAKEVLTQCTPCYQIQLTKDNIDQCGLKPIDDLNCLMDIFSFEPNASVGHSIDDAQEGQIELVAEDSAAEFTSESDNVC
jgi:hypothetical protein